MSDDFDPGFDFAHYDSDRIVKHSGPVAVSCFEGDIGEDNHTAVVNTMRAAMCFPEETDRAARVKNYADGKISYLTARAKHDEDTGSVAKILGAMVGEAYPDEIQKLDPVKPILIEWPPISADRVKMTVLPEKEGQKKSVLFYVTYDS